MSSCVQVFYLEKNVSLKNAGGSNELVGWKNTRHILILTMVNVFHVGFQLGGVTIDIFLQTLGYMAEWLNARW